MAFGIIEKVSMAMVNRLRQTSGSRRVQYNDISIKLIDIWKVWWHIFIHCLISINESFENGTVDTSHNSMTLFLDNIGSCFC